MAESMTVNVRLVRGFRNEQVEFPESMGGKTVEGRKPGTVHFSRDRVVTVTADELEWLRVYNPDLHAALEVLPEPAVSSRAARRFAQAEAQAKADAKQAKPEAPKRTKRTKRTKSEDSKAKGEDAKK